MNTHNFINSAFWIFFYFKIAVNICCDNLFLIRDFIFQSERIPFDTKKSTYDTEKAIADQAAADAAAAQAAADQAAAAQQTESYDYSYDNNDYSYDYSADYSYDYGGGDDYSGSDDGGDGCLDDGLLN